MIRRLALFTVLAVCAGTAPAHAHATLVVSDPIERVALGDTPAAVRLTFSERPDPAFSEIRVIDSAGAEHQLGRPLAAQDDPLTLFVNVRALDRGVYTVGWRAMSAVDGHASEGSFVFGVRVEPAVGPAAPPVTNAAASLPEGFARLVLIVGLVALLGGAAAAVARFGSGHDRTIAAAGCAVAVAGVVLLALMQAANARAPVARVLTTDLGRALLWRGAALGAAALALAFDRMRAALVVALAAVAVHVAYGHAAADGRWVAATIVSQWAHFAAAAIWFGGLAALLLGMRGQPAAHKTEAAQRFSRVATLALVIVALTGIVRTLGELSSWRDLVSTAYGLAVLAKIALSIAIVALAAVNHWHSLAAAAITLQPLRRAGSSELALAVCTLAAAALLGALPPPAAALKAPTGLAASGADFGTTVRVQLKTLSNQPGPNRFIVRATDYDSGQPIDATRVRLRFTSMDETAMPPTLLDLARSEDDTFVGSGANLAFGGRWRIATLIERSGDSAEVPLEVETAAPQQFIAIARPPGQPQTYRIQMIGVGHVWLSADPERAGRSAVSLAFWDLIQDAQSMQDVTVAVAAGEEPAREQTVTRISRSSFVADVTFQPGVNRISVVGHATNGKRIRAVLNLDVSD